MDIASTVGFCPDCGSVQIDCPKCKRPIPLSDFANLALSMKSHEWIAESDFESKDVAVPKDGFVRWSDSVVYVKDKDKPNEQKKVYTFTFTCEKCNTKLALRAEERYTSAIEVEKS